MLVLSAAAACTPKQAFIGDPPAQEVPLVFNAALLRGCHQLAAIDASSPWGGLDMAPTARRHLRYQLQRSALNLGGNAVELYDWDVGPLGGDASGMVYTCPDDKLPAIEKEYNRSPVF